MNGKDVLIVWLSHFMENICFLAILFPFNIIVDAEEGIVKT